MRVLIACEFSGRVREAFRKYNHDAWSIDKLPTEIPGNHIRDDVLYYVNNNHFDLMIAFPPCTYLCNSGARWLKKFHNRIQDQKRAILFVKKLFYCNIPRICIENPIGILSKKLRKPDQIIHPWQFGHGETKATCLWLKNLPRLQPTHIVQERIPKVHFQGESQHRWKDRSRTYTGIADAMALQWGIF